VRCNVFMIHAHHETNINITIDVGGSGEVIVIVF
jgi:hypothetical protein